MNATQKRNGAFVQLDAHVRKLEAETGSLRSQLALAVEERDRYRAVIEQGVLDLHFGCSDNQCVFADPPNQVGTNGRCTCITKTGFGQAVRRVHLRNKKALNPTNLGDEQ